MEKISNLLHVLPGYARIQVVYALVVDVVTPTYLCFLITPHCLPVRCTPTFVHRRQAVQVRNGSA